MQGNILYFVIHLLATACCHSIGGYGVDQDNSEPIQQYDSQSGPPPSLSSIVQSAIDSMNQCFGLQPNSSVQSVNAFIYQLDDQVEAVAGMLQDVVEPGGNEGYPPWVGRLFVEPFSKAVVNSAQQVTKDIYSGYFNSSQVDLGAYIHTLGTVSSVVDMYGFDSSPISNAITKLRSAASWRASHPQSTILQFVSSTSISELLTGPTHSVSGWD